MARAYLAIVLGPNAGSAKARVMFAVDGLEVKVWGTRDDVVRSDIVNGDIHGEADEEEEESEDNSATEETESESSDIDSESASGSGSCSGNDLEFGLDSSTDSIIGGTPPPSRSPSPSSSLSLSSRSPSPSPSHLSEEVLPTSQYPSEPLPKTAGPEHQTATYASEQQALRTAEQLLSRTLANACAEDGSGLASELGSSSVLSFSRAHHSYLPNEPIMCILCDWTHQPQHKHTSSYVPRGGSFIQLGHPNRIWELLWMESSGSSWRSLGLDRQVRVGGRSG